MTHSALDNVYAETASLVAARPELAAFAPFDTHAPAAGVGARAAPAMRFLQSLRAATHRDTAPLVAAIAAMAPEVHWRRPYTEEEVGLDFVNRFCSMELVGPTGHFRSSTIRAFIAYWGERLYYPWHLHEAEELYFILAGEARFEAAGQDSAILRPGDTRFHESNQPHDMTTVESPILALVLWRGAGLAGRPRIGRR